MGGVGRGGDLGAAGRARRESGRHQIGGTDRIQSAERDLRRHGDGHRALRRRRPPADLPRQPARRTALPLALDIRRNDWRYLWHAGRQPGAEARAGRLVPAHSGGDARDTWCTDGVASVPVVNRAYAATRGLTGSAATASRSASRKATSRGSPVTETPD